MWVGRAIDKPLRMGHAYGALGTQMLREEVSGNGLL